MNNSTNSEAAETAANLRQPSPSSAPARRVRDAEKTQLKLLEAALTLFSTQGFDASSTRQIECLAGVKRGLIAYHFGSKEELWKASVERLMSEAETELAGATSRASELQPEERLRFFIRSYVSFCARHPEINRLMMQEGMRIDWRLEWLLDRAVRKWYKQICALYYEAVTEGAAPKIGAHHFYYMVTGAATLMFSNAAEAEALIGKNPINQRTIDDHAEFLASLFIPREKS